MSNIFIILSLLVLSCIPESMAINADDRDIAWLKSRLSSNVSVGTTSSTNTYAEAVKYGQSHPTRDGESWSGWCASLMWRAGNLPESSACPTAIDAYHKSTIISKDYMSAPDGAFHWWDIGSDGHVAMAM